MDRQRELLSDVKLKRQSDEDLKAYQWRVCQNKDLGIYDITWKDVAFVLNHELEQNYDESAYRKWYQAGKDVLDLKLSNEDDKQKYIDDLRVAKMELEIARKKRHTENVYYNRIFREHARQEMLYEKIADAISKVEWEVPNFYPVQVGKANEHWLLAFGDVHAYKIFKSISNEYNSEVLEHRMNLLLGELIGIVKKEQIQKLTILNTGDNLEGILRTSALQSLELGVADTIVKYRRWILEWLKELSKYVYIDYIHLISSNHTEIRPLGTRANQFPAEDYEKSLATYLYDMVQNNGKLSQRLKVIIPNDVFHTFRLGEFNIFAHHGHGIKNIEKYVNSIERKKREFYDFVVLGHKHHEHIKTVGETINNDVEIIQVPSIMGTDSYADSLGVGAKASALLFKFEDGKGKTQTNKIILN